MSCVSSVCVCLFRIRKGYGAFFLPYFRSLHIPNQKCSIPLLFLFLRCRHTCFRSFVHIPFFCVCVSCAIFYMQCLQRPTECCVGVPCCCLRRRGPECFVVSGGRRSRRTFRQRPKRTQLVRLPCLADARCFLDSHLCK